MNIRKIDVRVAFPKREGRRRILTGFGKAFLNLTQLFRPDRGINRGGEACGQAWPATSSWFKAYYSPDVAGQALKNVWLWRDLDPARPHLDLGIPPIDAMLTRYAKRRETGKE
jgi:hypothetical protein